MVGWERSSEGHIDDATLEWAGGGCALPDTMVRGLDVDISLGLTREWACICLISAPSVRTWIQPLPYAGGV